MEAAEVLEGTGVCGLGHLWANMFHYSYVWLDESRTPYYVGKGSGGRALTPKLHRNIPYPDHLDRILIFEQENSKDARESERLLANLFGFRNDGSGTLMNLQFSRDTGFMSPIFREHMEKKMPSHKTTKGYKHSKETIQKLSTAARLREARREMRGDLHHWDGKKPLVSEETRQKLRESVKKSWIARREKSNHLLGK